MLPINTLQPVRKPAYTTYGLIVLNALVFLWQLTHSAAQLNDLYVNYAAVMCKVAATPISVDTTADILRSMFFHGGWEHIVGNMTFLWIFGRNAENYFGSKRFLLLYLFWGFIAAYTETIVNSGSCIPMVGASGGSGHPGGFCVSVDVRIELATEPVLSTTRGGGGRAARDGSARVGGGSLS